MAYTSEDVMAATFNRELVAEMGRCIGEDFQRAETESNSVYAGIYGPGANNTAHTIPAVTLNIILRTAGSPVKFAP